MDKTTNTDMTHKEILEQTKAELDRLVYEAKRKLDDLVKPELKVGKWYKFDTPLFEYLLKYDGSDTAYGFVDGEWGSSWSFSKDVNQELAKGKEATDQEVEEALVKEAKRRGFINGVIGNNSNIHDEELKNCELFFNNEYEFDNKDNLLRVILDNHATWTVFKDGKWAEVIKEVDKFAELKEAHKNGAVIQYYSNLRIRWVDVPDNDPAWFDHLEYRIKPEERPKVGDVCKFWNDDEDKYSVGVLTKDDKSKLPFQINNGNYFFNAKKLSKQDAIELLFGKEDSYND